MALDFSKLTAAVHKVADLAHAHANLSAFASSASDFEKTAQHEIDTLVAAIEAALTQTSPVDGAGAAGLAAVAQAVVDPSAPVVQAAPAAPSVAVSAAPDTAPSTQAAPAVAAASAPVSQVAPAAQAAANAPVQPQGSALGGAVPSVADTLAKVIAAAQANAPK